MWPARARGRNYSRGRRTLRLAPLSQNSPKPWKIQVSPKSAKVLPPLYIRAPRRRRGPHARAREPRSKTHHAPPVAPPASAWCVLFRVSRARKTVAYLKFAARRNSGARTLADFGENRKIRGVAQGGSQGRKLPTKNTRGTQKNIRGCQQKIQLRPAAPHAGVIEREPAPPNVLLRPGTPSGSLGVHPLEGILCLTVSLYI